MKLTRGLAALAFTAFTLSGTLGAQSRGGSRPTSHNGSSRGQTAERGRPDTHAQQHVAARPESRGRSDARSYRDDRARVDVRGHDSYRPVIVEHGRPLITRTGYRGVNYGGGYNSGYRYWHGINRFGVSMVLPFGWERPLFVRGFFPSAYFGYCEAVPYDLEYMLPQMYDGYDSCLIGDRIIVYNRFTRGISFVAVIP